MDQSYAGLLSALPPELVAEILDILRRGSPQDVLPLCATNSAARRFCQAPVIPWQSRYSDLAPYMDDIGNLASILDIARASLVARREARRIGRQCALDALVALLEQQQRTDSHGAVGGATVERLSDTLLPPGQILAGFARGGDVALFDIDDPGTVFYPDDVDVDDAVLIHASTYERDTPPGSDWRSVVVPHLQQDVASSPEGFYGLLNDLLHAAVAATHVPVTDIVARCRDVDLADALRDALPDAKFYVADFNVATGSGLGGLVLAPYGPLSGAAA